MNATATARPFQVGDRVRITDHNRHSVHPEAQYVYEGVVSNIDPASDPESAYEFGPYLWIDTEPYESPESGETHGRTFCELTDDLTTSTHPDVSRSIELLEPTPAPSDDTTPALVKLDQDDAAARVLKTSLAWHATDSDDITALREAFWAMKDAIAEYAAVAS